MDKYLNYLYEEIEHLRAIVGAAAAYRAAEQEATPRLVRGKKIHDLGVLLDKLLEGDR